MELRGGKKLWVILVIIIVQVLFGIFFFLPNGIIIGNRSDTSKDDVVGEKEEQNLEKLSEDIRKNPQNDEAYYQRGMIKYKKLEDYKGAIEDYDKAILINSKNRMAYFFRGNAKRELKECSSAITDYSKFLEINSNSSNDSVSSMAYYYRGVCKVTLENYEEGIKDYNEAIRINPQLIEAYYSRGLAKILINEKNGACSDFNYIIELGNDWAKSTYEDYCIKGK